MVVVPDLVVESDDRNLDALDLEEGLPGILVGVLESDVERDTLGSELDVQQTRVLKGDPTGLITLDEETR